MMSAPIIPDTITGAELVALIEREAAARQLKPAVLIERISAQPHRWLGQVRRAVRPRANTLHLVRSLFAGNLAPHREPARVPTSRQSATGRRRPNHFVAAKPDTAPPPVDRDPCAFCGTRADVGCRHTHQRERIS